MISREEVLNLAELARLKLSDAEVAALQKDISSILEYVGQVAKVELSEGSDIPLVHNVMRADAPRPAADPLSGKEAAVRAAFPVHEGDYNVVRKIIQKDE